MSETRKAESMTQEELGEAIRLWCDAERLPSHTALAMHQKAKDDVEYWCTRSLWDLFDAVVREGLARPLEEN